VVLERLNVRDLGFFTVMKIHVAVFWVMTPCSDVVEYRRFEGCVSGGHEEYLYRIPEDIYVALFFSQSCTNLSLPHTK